MRTKQVLLFISCSPISLSGQTHLWLSCAQLAASASGTGGGGSCSGGSSLGSQCCRCFRPARTRCLSGHSPPEETHAHLQQLAVDHWCDGVLLCQALRKAERVF